MTTTKILRLLKIFFEVQNKVIFAITGKTAPELIIERVDSKKAYMGLTIWKGSPESKIHASDVVISKNYLNHQELKNADRLVDGFLSTAEFRVESQRKKEKPILLKDWSNLLDDYINLNQLDILKYNGNVSKIKANEPAKKEYDKYRSIQDKIYKSDNNFRLEEVVKVIKRIEGKKKD